MPTSDQVDSTKERPAEKRTAVAAVIYNPIKLDVDELKAAVEAAEARHGWGKSQWYETSPTDAGQEVATQAIEAGATMVLAAGGDGTVRAVAESVHGSSASLALLPAGTGNLLARNLDLTLDDMDHAVEVAFGGKDRKIDFGMIEIRRPDKTTSRHGYVVMAGLGLDAKMLANTSDELKKQIGWLAYVQALTRALRDKNELGMRYKVDGGQERSLKAHTVIVGNCGALPANIVLLPDAAIDDGKFDILILRPDSVIGWAQIFTKVLWENGVVRRTRLGDRFRRREISALRYTTAKSLRVTLTQPQDIELDGDEFGKAVSFTTWVEPSSLRVRVPADADAKS